MIIRTFANGHDRGLSAEEHLNVLFRSSLLVVMAAVALLAPATRAQQPNAALDTLFDRREVRIPMRDGVHLFTVILTPKRQSGPLPVIMSRTPYGTGGWGGTRGIEPPACECH